MVNKQTIKADLIAGFTGAVIVLPQGVAFATIAGLPPEYGLYTAMVTPIIAALFGSSLHLISGPTTAISIVIFSAVSRHAVPGSEEFINLALTITFLAGVYQFAFGVARLGALVNFVSHTVVVGFTAGAAILIATSQMKHVLGVEVPRGESFLHTWTTIYDHLSLTNYYVLAIGLVTLLTALLVKKFLPVIPNLLAGLIVGSVLALLLHGAEHGVALVGEIPGHLPPLSHPDLSFESLRLLAPEAFAVALLGLIEAVSISRSVAARSHQRIDGNQEFIGQGLSNIAGSFFSSYAGSGSFTRSGINYSAGAKTPMSAIFAAAFLALIVVLIAPLTAYLPIAAMGGVILLVAYNLIDVHHIKEILLTSKSETAILLTTFFATLFLELEFAIYLGVLLSLVLFLNRTSTPDIVELGPAHEEGSSKKFLANVKSQPVPQCPQLKIIRIDMSIYFGSASHIQSKLHEISEKHGYHHILIICSGVNFIDMSGAEMLAQEAKRLEDLGGGLYFAEIKSKVYDFISRVHFIRKIGNNHFFDEKKLAIREIVKRLDHDICRTCKVRVFDECATLPGAK
ncbi:MAG TPA: SulP family inorganic anion transporter [Gammaproteobacteria bacterium]|nr:SulP family inorganic anion transporter [Gammaproteobacteria bacterium]